VRALGQLESGQLIIRKEKGGEQGSARTEKAGEIISRVVMSESENGRGEASAPPAPLPAAAVRVMVVVDLCSPDFF
jgi:hypothetical protein